MDKQIVGDTRTDSLAKIFAIMPGVERLIEALPSGTPDVFRQRRKIALDVFAKCCEIWNLADQANLLAVRDNIESALLLAYDACFHPRKSGN